MKCSLLLLPLFIFLQVGSCEDDDSSSTDDGDISESYVEFLDERTEAYGGCNEESTTGTNMICVFAGSFQRDGLGYTVAISHSGLCRSATFSIEEELEGEGDAYFVLQVTENGVSIESFVGIDGTVNLVDAGTATSMRFNGTVRSNADGSLETIEGYIVCPL